MKGKEEKNGAVEGWCVFCLECKSHTHTERHIHTRVQTEGRNDACYVNALKTLEFSCALLNKKNPKKSPLLHSEATDSQVETEAKRSSWISFTGKRSESRAQFWSRKQCCPQKKTGKNNSNKGQQE